MPTFRLRLLYDRCFKPRCLHWHLCLDVFMMPFLSIACFLAAIFIALVAMPCHWMYESFVRGLVLSAEETKQQLLEETSNETDEVTSLEEEMCVFENQPLVDWVLGLLNQGRTVLTHKDVEFKMLMSETEIDPLTRKEKKFNVYLRADQRTEIQSYFMRDMRNLDIGMLWCFSSNRHCPPLLAAQLEQTFTNSFGHDGRVEYMLKKLMSQKDSAGELMLWDPIARLGSKAAKLDIHKLQEVGGKLEQKLHVKSLLKKLRRTTGKKKD
eukprot:gnl/MRDRNA2_/MRDRNA2_135043_c0_seq1.p1 gnl/MRDRNA2_/MRDRNA2_135043_c0~~gnl/MRDRNA2_/MRDRNA2_135043_c0_seq1.p1  ORF type:complete len:267 (+),score=36.79 gnl/MRDRNA2_/MRDRNA2_135043_c0_seq1:2-802(+)